MQYAISPVNRTNISGSLVIKLREMIVDGRLADGVRINEVHLAESLGVSRTPLREALNRLVSEEALTVIPKIGYFVRPLTAEELHQLYPIRAILDPEALRLAGIPSPERLGHLDLLNQEIKEAQGAMKVIELDDQWHLELLADCPNNILIDLIKTFIIRTRRYEMALMRERKNVQGASGDHQKILDALRAGDLEGGCDALRRNMQSGVAPIMDWLKERQELLKESGVKK